MLQPDIDRVSVMLPVTFDLDTVRMPLNEKTPGRTSCTMSLKSMEFETIGRGGHEGYTNGVTLTKFKGTMDSTHLISFGIRGLIQDYGWNAVSIAFTRVDDDTQVLRINSQQFAPDSTCTVSLLLSVDSVSLYVESSVAAPEWYHPPFEFEPSASTTDSTKGYQNIAPGVFRHTIAWPWGSAGTAPPTLSLLVMESNVVDIVPPYKTGAFRTIMADCPTPPHIYA